jgi:hypothetical protein
MPISIEITTEGAAFQKGDEPSRIISPRIATDVVPLRRAINRKSD